MDQQTFLKHLTQLNGSMEALFSEIQPDLTGWRPRDNMRTTMELANHVAQLPHVDLMILRGAAEADVRGLEVTLRRVNPADLVAVWKTGVAAVTEYFTALTPEQFQTQVGKAFYGHEATMPDWLMEIITHAHHHRAQLFTYLKMQGRPVDMFTLYL